MEIDHGGRPDRCENCRFWAWQWTEDALHPEDVIHVGECRRRAPSYGPPAKHYRFTGHWPQTMNIEWCGEFERRAQGQDRSPVGRGGAMDEEEMTDAEQLAAWLADASQFRDEDEGGYPDSVAVVEGHVVVASVDSDGAAELTVHPPRKVAKWASAARKCFKECPEADLLEVLRETKPSSDE